VKDLTPRAMSSLGLLSMSRSLNSSAGQFSLFTD